jgi:predicted PurR-regulated permease PerM
MNFDTIDKISLYRLLIALTAGFLLLIGCFIIIKPFIPALMLALIFALSTWPAFQWLESKLGGRITLASVLMTLLLAAAFLIPIVVLGSSLADNVGQMFKDLLANIDGNTKEPPQWLLHIPVIGQQLGDTWLSYSEDRQKIIATLTLYAGPISQFALMVGAAVAKGIVDLALGVIISYFFFRYGVQVAERISNLISTFAGNRGQYLLDVSKKTMIGVIYGILGTAIAQGALGGLGFWIAGLPNPAFLGLLTFFVSIIPFGPPLVWVPATIYLIAEQEYYSAIFMALYGSCVISLLDNIIRPYFISVGSNLPILLVLMGVIGGILAFGFIGLFIGPVLLAIAMTLALEWSNAPKKAEKDDPSGVLDISA